jgi:hypothetical protein
VAFMLVHFFCLLGFKFKFEFHCLNPFQTQNQNFLNHLPLSPFQPNSQPRPAQASQQPSSPAAGRSRLSRARDPALRPNWPAQQPLQPAAAAPRLRRCG